MSLLRQAIRKLTAPRSVPPAASDGELLERFVSRKEERAFEELIHRHGKLVYAVAVRVMRDKHAAEDVFQATFLVLARDAARIRNRDSVAAWLHGIALKLAKKALRRRHRLLSGEVDVDSLTTNPFDAIGTAFDQQVLDEELQKLPLRYRDPLVLHFLEGLTYEQTAAALGVSVGTVQGRIKRGKRELHLMLARRGVGFGIAMAAMAWSQSAAQAAVSTAIVQTSLAGGLAISQGVPFATVCSSEAVHLAAKETAMFVLGKSMIVATGLALSAGVGWMAANGNGAPGGGGAGGEVSTELRETFGDPMQDAVQLAQGGARPVANPDLPPENGPVPNAPAGNFSIKVGPDGKLFIEGLEKLRAVSVGPDGTIRFNSVGQDGRAEISSEVLQMFGGEQAFLKWLEGTIGPRPQDEFLRQLSQAWPSIDSGETLPGASAKLSPEVQPENGLALWAPAANFSIKVGPDGKLVIEGLEKLGELQAGPDGRVRMEGIGVGQNSDAGFTGTFSFEVLQMLGGEKELLKLLQGAAMEKLQEKLGPAQPAGRFSIKITPKGLVVEGLENLKDLKPDSDGMLKIFGEDGSVVTGEISQELLKSLAQPSQAPEPEQRFTGRVRMSEQEHRIEQALSNRLESKISELPMREVVNFLSARYGIQMMIDVAQLQQEGLDGTEDVSCPLSNLPLRSALKVMFREVKSTPLTYVIEDDILKVTTRAYAETKYVNRIYQFADLQGIGEMDVSILSSILTGTSGTWKPFANDSAEMKEAFVHLPKFSPDSEGAVIPTGDGMGMMIRQTLAVHGEIEEILRQFYEYAHAPRRKLLLEERRKPESNAYPAPTVDPVPTSPVPGAGPLSPQPIPQHLPPANSPQATPNPYLPVPHFLDGA